MPPPSTARLDFHLWSMDDLELAFALWGDPQVTTLIGGPFSREQVEARLRKEIANAETAGIQYWPIFVRENGEHAGCCGLRPYNPQDKIFALGFHLRPSCWGKGYGLEAARAVIDHAFTTLGASALFAGHHPRNDRSRALLQKLGFRYWRDELYPPTGLMHPSYLLDREPPASMLHVTPS